MSQSQTEQAFEQFHAKNPHIYHRLVRLTRDLAQRGHRKIGMKMLFEVLRWHYAMTTSGDTDGFKLNNNYTSYYARLIMAREPGLAGIYETRQLHAAEPYGQTPSSNIKGHIAPPRVKPDDDDDDAGPQVPLF